MSGYSDSRLANRPVLPSAGRPVAGTAPARLIIDWTRCDGHGLCSALLPEAITLDDWGYPVLDQAALGREPDSALNRAVSCCPALALRRS